LFWQWTAPRSSWKPRTCGSLSISHGLLAVVCSDMLLGLAAIQATFNQGGELSAANELPGDATASHQSDREASSYYSFVGN